MSEQEYQYADELTEKKRLMQMQQDPKQEDTIRFLINPEAVIKEKMMILNGYQWDVKANKWSDDESTLRPMMNKLGLQFALNELNHILNKFIPQANLEKVEVTEFIMAYSRRVRSSLVTNIEQFEISSIADLDQIKNIIVETAWFLLTQPINDKGRKFIYSPLKTVESHTYGETSTQPKRKIGW